MIATKYIIISMRISFQECFIICIRHLVAYAWERTYEYLRQEFPQVLSHNFINAVEQLIVKKINIRNFFLNGTEYYLFGKILLQNLFLLVTFSGYYYVQISRY